MKEKLYNINLYDNLLKDFNIVVLSDMSKKHSSYDLKQIIKEYSNFYEDFKLYIVGEVLMSGVTPSLQKHIVSTEKEPIENFHAYYKSADVFICMDDDHLITDTLLSCAPIIFYTNANKSTKAGVIVSKKDYCAVASCIQLIRENPKLRYEILQSQTKTLKHTTKIKYQFEGPFDSSYSLATLNKNAAKVFDEYFEGEVSLYSLEGGGDFKPNETFLNTHAEIKRLFDNSQKAINAEVTFRNCYPPNVRGMKSELNILNSYGWEESAFPKEYVKSFNENLDGIIAVSHYVKKVLINNGVKTPIKVIHNSIDHILHVKPKPYALKTKKSFRFLHVSSCFPRKGIDILLQAYAQAFTKNDDVVLIIKTFPNPHNDIEKQIEDMQKKFHHFPDIEVINEDLDEAYLIWLYQNTNALVAPSKGEGFGLPMAEAMLFDLPVLTTGYGGQTDFCTDKTSWLIDYTFEKSKSHMQLFDSYWVNPSFNSLAHLLKEQTMLTTKQKKVKTDKAKEFVLKEFKWKNYLQKTLAFIDELKTQVIFDTQEKNLAWISSYNTKCGIATYSEFLLEYFYRYNIKIYANYSHEIISKQKETNVIRCWSDRFDTNNTKLTKEVVSNKTTHVVINFNFAFFSMKNLENMLKFFHEKNIKTTIIFHSVDDVLIKGLEASLSLISETLKEVNSLLVHSLKDLNLLKSFGLVQNVTLFSHGSLPQREKEHKKKSTTLTIASYGFLLPQKGIEELIAAFSLVQAIIPQTKLLLVNALYPLKVSKDYLITCKKLVKKLNLTKSVEFVTDFLSDEESFEYLEKADLLVMPYKKTNESASGAVRYAICTAKPVLCTKQAIFDDVADIVHFIKGFSSEDIADSIIMLLQDAEQLGSKYQKQKKWIKEHDWKSISKLLQNLI